MAVVWEYLVPHSSHPTLYVLFLITFTKPLPERLLLRSNFKYGIRERVNGRRTVSVKGWQM